MNTIKTGWLKTADNESRFGIGMNIPPENNPSFYAFSIDDLIFRLEAMVDDERYCPDEWSRAILMQSTEKLKGLRQE